MKNTITWIATAVIAIATMVVVGLTISNRPLLAPKTKIQVPIPPPQSGLIAPKTKIRLPWPFPSPAQVVQHKETPKVAAQRKECPWCEPSDFVRGHAYATLTGYRQATD